MRRLLHVPDAWWPVLSRNGQDLVAGNTAIKAWHLPGVAHEAQSAHWHAGSGRNGRFIRPSVLTFTRERSALTHERWEYDLRTGKHDLMDDDYGFVAGNEFEADESGHWASWLAVTGRITYDGRPVAYEAHGIELAGDLICYAMHGLQQLVVRNVDAGIDTRYALPHDANARTLTPDGYIGYGYYWAARVIQPSHEIADVTCTPWRAETVPVLCRARCGDLSPMWAWTYSERPGDKRGLVMGRPLHDPTHAIVIEGFDADAWLSVAYREDRGTWIVAGNSSVGGVMSVWEIPYETPRTAVQDVWKIRTTSKPLVYAPFYDVSVRYPERYDFPGNADIVVEPGALSKTTLPLIVTANVLPDVDDPARIYALLHVEEDETHFEQKADELRTLFASKWPSHPLPPVLAYVLPGMVERGWDPVASSIDVFCPQIYFDMGKDITSEALTTWVTYWRERLPVDRPWLFTSQAYDRVTEKLRMSQLAAVTPQFLDVANALHWVLGFLWFSVERPGGVADYQVLKDVHEACYRVVGPMGLPLLPVREMLKKPEVTVDAWDRELTPANTWRARFHDRENDCHVEVRLEQGRLWIEMSNSKGVGKTGAVRQVNIHD